MSNNGQQAAKTPRRPFSVWLQESGSMATRELLEGVAKVTPSAGGDVQSNFLGLRTNPFANGSNPANLVLTRRTQRLFNELVQAIEDQAGLLLLTGEVGTGKTTLVNQLRAWLSMMSVPTAFIFNPLLDNDEFFKLVLVEFGIRLNPAATPNALTCLHNWLRAGNRSAKTPVLIIDEAQSLSLSVFESLGLLLNWETPRERLLQIVLVGQPELNHQLQRPELRKLQQRIAVRCTTAPLSNNEFRAYINLRLRSAEWDGHPAFSEEAMAAILRYSQGIPRVINLLCEHALNLARGEGMCPVPARIVEEVARQFRYNNFHTLSFSPPLSPFANGFPGSAPAPNSSITRGDLAEEETDLEGRLGLTKWISEITNIASPRAEEDSADVAHQQKIQKTTAELHPKDELASQSSDPPSSTSATGVESRIWLHHTRKGKAHRLLAKCRSLRDSLRRWLQKPLSTRRLSRTPRSGQA